MNDQIEKTIKESKNTFPLDIYLLKLIFSENHGKVKNLHNRALSILIYNFNQRITLMEEIAKIEILVSDEDKVIYRKCRKSKIVIQEITDYLLQMDMHHQSNMNMDRGEIASMGDSILMTINTLKEQLQVTNNRKISKHQNIMRHLKIHEDLMRLIMGVRYHAPTHARIFKHTIEFLFRFSYRHSVNQALLLPYIKPILSITN